MGRYSVDMKAAPGSGTATNFYLFTHGRQNDRSQPWNEIDFELLGGQAGSNSCQIWTNFFIDHGRQSGKAITVPFDTQADYHTYTLDVSKSAIKWIVDGQMIRMVDIGGFHDMVSTIVSGQFQVILSLWGRDRTGGSWAAMGFLEDNTHEFPLIGFFKHVQLNNMDHETASVLSMSGCPKRSQHQHPQTCDDIAIAKRSVRCCSLDGEAVAMSSYGCNQEKTFEAAVHICSSTGLRLCTSVEIQSNNLCGVGCGFDFERVWTSTGCS